MAQLPIRTKIEDAETICGFLASRPTGATLLEMKQILDSKVLDGRKLSALKYWGLIELKDEKYRVSELGRGLAKNQREISVAVYRQVIAGIRPYHVSVERAAHRREASVTASDVAFFWHENFASIAGEKDKTLNDQAVCFFQLAQGAELGILTIGRRGAPTRFDFDLDKALSFLRDGGIDMMENIPETEVEIANTENEEVLPSYELGGDGSDIERKLPVVIPVEDARAKKVFVTHGKNRQLIELIKKLLKYGELEAVVSVEKTSVSQPVPEKIIGEMRQCGAAIIHVESESGVGGTEAGSLNPNVLIEVGAAMALYGKRIILLVGNGTTLPSNLQGLFEVRYSGNSLDGDSTMKLLDAIGDIKNHPMPQADVVAA